MQNGKSYLTRPFVILAICGPIPTASQAQMTGDATAGNIVAAQVRQQGYACEAPTSAAREAGSEGSWILRCGNASYRVQLVPDMAARIEKIN